MRAKNLLLIILGVTFLGLGAVGILLPVLPTTPFVLAAAACFSAGSQRLDNWLRQSRLFGPYIENYRTKQGISKLRKVVSIAFLWAGLLISMAVVRTALIVVALSLVGACVTVHLLKIKTKSD